MVREVADELADDLPEAGSPASGLRQLLDLMVASNIDNVMTALVTNLPPSQLRATTSSLELARRFGERGISPQRTVRIYQVGHRALLRRLLAGFAAELPKDAETIVSLAEFVDWNLAYVNLMSQAAVEEHIRAQALWARSRGGATAEQLAHVLDADLSPAEASELLSYQMAATHVALSIWSPSTTVTRETLVQITQALSGHPSVLETLVVPLDLGTVMVWLSVDGVWTAALARLERTIGRDSVRVACGEPAPGLDGFRRTRTQALAARRVAEMPGSLGQRVVRYRDVAATSLLALHPDEAVPWAEHLLGELTADTAEVAKLRETLRVYLETGENASTTALRMNLHRNTVKYRVERALEKLPVDLDQNRLSVSLALAYFSRCTPTAE